MKTSRFGLILALIWLALPSAASSLWQAERTPPPVQRPSDLCTRAALQAAQETGVPAEILLAITLTETGRTRDGQLRPWPWTANFDGRGHWFASRAEALEFARARMDQNQRLFDLGCFQINWRWHNDQFDAPADLLDPLTSARYAARLLARFHRSLGSWEAAAGAYHSRTPRYADRYRRRFRQMRPHAQTLQASLEASANTRFAQTRAPHATNAFPLLTGGATHGPSLVPLASVSTARPFLTAESQP